MVRPKELSFSDYVVNTLNGTAPGRWEVDCKRELSVREFARQRKGVTIHHRYGWPGGYTFKQLLQRGMMQGNPFFSKD